MQLHPLMVAGHRTPCHDSGGQATDAVLFLHGNPNCGADWLPLAREVGAFARCLAPDMPGFGQADKRDDFDYTVAGYAAHVEALRAACGVERLHLVLHDFGGPWGLAWAAQHPRRVASVTLVNIGILRSYRWHYLARIWRTPLLGELFQATTTRFAFELSLKHGNPRGLPREFVERMYANYDRGTRRAVLKLYRATGELDQGADLVHAALRPLDLDCLVLWGERDPYISPRYAAAQRETFPRAEVVTLPDSGHWPHIDDPAAAAGALVPFLRRVASA